ncbi:metalloregulator ArsR/SmtB family transcription factor [Bacillus sp. NSP9.1]|nr:metalloregulator ArsR/SmtB family transcription factor [Bacillus sp. NSP9.1]
MNEKNQDRDIYAAVADPTRRQLMRLLADVEELPLKELTAHFDMGRTAISKHLAILKEAGLVMSRKAGRETRYRLNAAPLKEIEDWVSFYRKFWSERMLLLDQILKEEQNMDLTVSHDFTFESPIEKVWLALTDADTLAKWIMPNDFKPVVGHQFQFRNEQWNLIIDSEVLEIDEPYKLSYTWVGGGINTTVTWTLKHEEGKTSLHLEHTGFEKEDQAFNGAKFGWAKMGEDLKKLLEEM